MAKNLDISGIDFAEQNQPQEPAQKKAALDLSDINFDLSDVDFSDMEKELPPVPGKNFAQAPTATATEEPTWNTAISSAITQMPERMKKAWEGIKQGVSINAANTQDGTLAMRIQDAVKASGQGIESATKYLADLGVNPADITPADGDDYKTKLAKNQKLYDAVERAKVQTLQNDQGFMESRAKSLQLAGELAASAPPDSEKWSAKNLLSTVATGAADMAPSILTAILFKSPAAGLSQMTGQAYGGYMQDALDKGLTPGQAGERAGLFAALEPVTEAVPMGLLLKKGANKLTDLGKSAIAEGLQEGATQAIQDAYDVGRLNEKMTVGDFLSDVGFNALTGAGTGGVIHAGIHAPGMIKDFKDTRAVNAATKTAAAESGQAAPTIDPGEYDAVNAEMGTGDALDKMTERAVPTISEARRAAYADARARGLSPSDAMTEARGQDSGADLLDQMVADVFDSPDSVYYANKQGVTSPTPSVTEMVQQAAAQGELPPLPGEIKGLPSPGQTSTIALPGRPGLESELTGYQPTGVLDERQAPRKVAPELEQAVSNIDFSDLPTAQAELPPVPTESPILARIQEKAKQADLPPVPEAKLPAVPEAELPSVPEAKVAETAPVPEAKLPAVPEAKVAELPPSPKKYQFGRAKKVAAEPVMTEEELADQRAEQEAAQQRQTEQGESYVAKNENLPPVPGKDGKPKLNPLQQSRQIVAAAKERGVEPGAKVNWNGKEHTVDKLQGKAVRLIDENGNGHIADIQEVNAPAKAALDISDVDLAEPAAKERGILEDPVVTPDTLEDGFKPIPEGDKYHGATAKRGFGGTVNIVGRRGDAESGVYIADDGTKYGATKLITRDGTPGQDVQLTAKERAAAKPKSTVDTNSVNELLSQLDNPKRKLSDIKTDMAAMREQSSDKSLYEPVTGKTRAAIRKELEARVTDTIATSPKRKDDKVTNTNVQAEGKKLTSNQEENVKKMGDYLGLDLTGRAHRVKNNVVNIDTDGLQQHEIHAIENYGRQFKTYRTEPGGVKQISLIEDKGEKAPSLKADKAAEPGMKDTDVAAVATDFVKKFKGTQAVDMSVMQSQADLGIDIPEGQSLMGFYDIGGISAKLVADNIGSVEETEALLRHELIVHYGLRARLPRAEYNAEMDKVLAAEKSLALRKYFAEARAKYDDFYDTSSPDGQRMIAEEVVAKVAEDPKALEKSSLIQRVIEAIRQMLITAKILPAKASMESVHQLIRANAEFLKNTTVDRNDVRVSLPPMGYNAPQGMAPAMNKSTDIDKADVPDSLKTGMKSVLARDDRSMYQRITDMLKENFNRHHIYQGLFDDLNAIAVLEKEKNSGNLLPGNKSAYKFSMLAKNINSIVAMAMNVAPPKYENGSVVPNRGVKPFTQVFKPVMELKGNMLPVWEYWAGAVRAKRLLAEGRENLYTQQQIDDIIDYVNRRPELRKAFNEAHKDWRALNKAVLDFGEQTGIVDPEQRKLFESDDYVPFYRVDEEADKVSGPAGKRGLANQSSGIRKLKGGEGKLDILENMAQNINHMITSGYKNAAMQRIKDIAIDAGLKAVPNNFKPVGISNDAIKKALNDMGVATSGMSKKQLEGYTNLFTVVAPAGPNIISIRYDGKPQYFEVTDRALMQSIAGIGPERIDLWLKVLDLPKRILTFAITANPAFAVKNVMRDVPSAFMQLPPEAARNNKVIQDILTLRPIRQAIRGAVASLTQNGMVQEYQTSGGMSEGYDQSRPESVANHLRKLEKRNVIVNSPAKMWELYKKVLKASEQATRMGTYADVLAATNDPTEAAYQANDVLNFSRKGSYFLVHFLTAVTPFLNARAQGLDRLARGGKASPKAFALKAAIMVGATMSLMALNADDEEYWALPEYERDSYWIIPVNGTRFRIPKPFEVGAMFGTIPERIFEAVTRDDKVLGSRLAFMLGQTFGLDLPQFVKPIYEDQTNMNSFTQRPIVPQSLSRVQPTEQVSQATPEWLKSFAKSLPESAPDWMRSPLRLQHMIEAYTGTLGHYTISTATDGYNALFSDKVMPAKREYDMPILRDFVRTGEPSNKYVDRLYSMSQKAGEAYGTLKAYKDQKNREAYQSFATENKSVLAARRDIDKSVAAMQKLNKRTKAIYADNDLTPEAKRQQLDALTAQKNDLAEKMNDKYWRLF